MMNSCLLVFKAFNFFEMMGFPSVLGLSYKLLMTFVLRIITLLAEFIVDDVPEVFHRLCLPPSLRFLFVLM